MKDAYTPRNEMACKTPEPSNVLRDVMASPPTGERESEIARELNHLRDSISQLESAVEHLEGRVEVVCAPPVPEPANGECAKGPMSAFGRVIAEDAQRVGMVTNRIARILSRVQL